MTTVAAGATGTYTFSATGTVDIALTAGDSAQVTILRSGAAVFSQAVASSRNIGPFLSGDVMTLTANRNAVDYTVNAYTAAQAAGDVGFANPMTTAGDTIIGGTSGVAARQAKVMTTAGDLYVGGTAGAPARLAAPGAGTFALQSIDGVLTWTAVV